MRALQLLVILIVSLGCVVDSPEQAFRKRAASSGDEMTPREEKMLEEYRNRKVELRLISDEAVGNPVVFDATGEQVYLTDTNVLTGRDIFSMNIAKNSAGKPCINLLASGEADRRIRKITRQNVGKSAAILVNGEVKHIFQISNPFGRHIEISGGLTEKELTELMLSMEGRGI